MEEDAISSSASNESSDDLVIDEPVIPSCSICLRESPPRRKEKVYVGCGAGFSGDRPLAALKLLERVKELDYLVLECLAERTLADRFHAKASGGPGYDPRISEWMHLLLPLALERGVCIITNLGANDSFGARKEVLRVASRLGISISVGVAMEFALTRSGLDPHLRDADGVRIWYLLSISFELSPLIYTSGLML
ncbi:unnamed protein product [Ilex paraguariensis]|uniref:Acyclic terpene utilisation N-terminal domain-containing protein n=1 Tax=Ilex paraguariensis TaxID=185542 RepID=A0ABC8UGA3_9AQUA